jgi:site-specific recombinase XerC
LPDRPGSLSGVPTDATGADRTRPEQNPVNELHWTAFQRHLRHKKRSDLTIKSYRTAFDDLLVVHGGQDVAHLTKTDLEDWQIDALDRLSATTVAIRFRSLHAFYNWLVAEDEITVSPMARLSEPKGTDRPPPVLDDDQLGKLLKACDGKRLEDRRDTAIIRLFCEPGSPRVSEMAGIMVDDLDLRRDQVRVTGKGDKVRDIPFGAKTGVALDRYLRLRKRHRMAGLPNLWLGKAGVFTKWGVTQMLARRAEVAGIGHVHPHQLRHTAAHDWKDNGGSDEDAMALFGWASAEMPRRYGRSAATARAQRAARRESRGDRL